MNDNSKTTLVCPIENDISDLVVCGDSFHTRATLSYDMSLHKLDLIQLAFTHLYGMPNIIM